MAKAKTASKNNPTSREKAKVFYYQGKVVKPAKFIGAKGTYMSAEYEDGNVVEDANGDPITWGDIHSSN